MLYYERVRNEDRPSVPVWSSHPRRATNTTDNDDDNDDCDGGDLGGIDDGVDNGQENAARTHHSRQDVVKVKYEPGMEVLDDEMEEVPVIKARVVRSVSLGAGDDSEGASLLVKHEAELEELEEREERERDGNGDEGSRSSSHTPANPQHVESTVDSLPTSSMSNEPPSPLPEAPAVDVDEPPIGAAPQSVDLRA